MQYLGPCRGESKEQYAQRYAAVMMTCTPRASRIRTSADGDTLVQNSRDESLAPSPLNAKQSGGTGMAATAQAAATYPGATENENVLWSMRQPGVSGLQVGQPPNMQPPESNIAVHSRQQLHGASASIQRLRDSISRILGLRKLRSKRRVAAQQQLQEQRTSPEAAAASPMQAAASGKHHKQGCDVNTHACHAAPAVSAGADKAGPCLANAPNKTPLAPEDHIDGDPQAGALASGGSGLIHSSGNADRHHVHMHKQRPSVPPLFSSSTEAKLLPHVDEWVAMTSPNSARRYSSHAAAPHASSPRYSKSTKGRRTAGDGALAAAARSFAASRTSYSSASTSLSSTEAAPRRLAPTAQRVQGIKGKQGGRGSAGKAPRAISYSAMEPPELDIHLPLPCMNPSKGFEDQLCAPDAAVAPATAPFPLQRLPEPSNLPAEDWEMDGCAFQAELSLTRADGALGPASAGLPVAAASSSSLEHLPNTSIYADNVRLGRNVRPAPKAGATRLPTAVPAAAAPVTVGRQQLDAKQQQQCPHRFSKAEVGGGCLPRPLSDARLGVDTPSNGQTIPNAALTPRSTATSEGQNAVLRTSGEAAQSHSQDSCGAAETAGSEGSAGMHNVGSTGTAAAVSTFEVPHLSLQCIAQSNGASPQSDGECSSNDLVQMGSPSSLLHHPSGGYEGAWFEGDARLYSGSIRSNSSAAGPDLSPSSQAHSSGTSVSTGTGVGPSGRNTPAGSCSSRCTPRPASDLVCRKDAGKGCASLRSSVAPDASTPSNPGDTSNSATAAAVAVARLGSEQAPFRAKSLTAEDEMEAYSTIIGSGQVSSFPTCEAR